MTEDKFEEFLRKQAQSYNAPPARAPREEMWNAIQATRTAGPRVVYGGGLLRDLSGRRFGSKVWLGAAAAAVLLVATGVGIGRWTAAPNDGTQVVAAGANPAAQSPRSAQPAPSDALPSDVLPSNVLPSEGGGVATGKAEINPPSGATAPSSRGKERPRVELGGRGEPAVVAEAPSTASPSSAYQLTAVRHLSEAEALLTSFRTRSPSDKQMDAQLGSWARELLTNTRLLLDSPVANDPQRRPLLEDLELVLVQIVQLSPGSTPQDREMIEKTLQQDHVMTRLRTAIPAGSQRGS
jgi:hypothetical protein